MTPIWWLVNVVSRMLEPAERDAVRGDFAESGEPGGKALRDVLGLVIRRQTALWKDWRLWRDGVHYGTGLSVGEDWVYFVLGSLSGRAVWLTGSLFCLVVHDAYLSPLVLSGNFQVAQLPLFVLTWVLPPSLVMFPFVPWPRRMLPLATLSWPVLYMLATASWRRWRDKSAPV